MGKIVMPTSQLTQSIAAIIVVITILFLIIVDPFGETSGKIALAGLISGFSVWSLLRHWRVGVPSRMITFLLGDQRCSWQDRF
jgi:hypothetical protein